MHGIVWRNLVNSTLVLSPAENSVMEPKESREVLPAGSESARIRTLRWFRGSRTTKTEPRERAECTCPGYELFR